MHQGCLDALRDSGLARYVVPAAYGGHDEVLDPLAIAVVREQLMYSSAHLDSMFGMQGVGSYSLSVGRLRGAASRSGCPRSPRSTRSPALALTEPDVGSDLRASRPRSISRRRRAASSTAASRSSPTAARPTSTACWSARATGWSMVLVPADTPGLSDRAGADLIAPHILGELHLRRRRVPGGQPARRAGQGVLADAADARGLPGHRRRLGRRSGPGGARRGAEATP